MVLDNRLKEIIKNKNFTNFWEVFEFFKVVGYEEVESLMMASDLFNGDIWKDILTVNIKKHRVVRVNCDGEGHVMAADCDGAINWTPVAPTGDDIELSDADAIMAQIYFMTPQGNNNYRELYKHYIKTKEYEHIKEFDEHIKCVTVELNTELGLSLFKEGNRKLK